MTSDIYITYTYDIAIVHQSWGMRYSNVMVDMEGRGRAGLWWEGVELCMLVVQL